MVFLLIKFFAEIAYQWITVTHPFCATGSFSSFVVPNPGMEVTSYLPGEGELKVRTPSVNPFGIFL